MKSQSQMSIVPRDVEPLLRAHEGNQLFTSALLKETDGEFLQVFARYVAYSTAFAPRILRLAEVVAQRADIFADAQQAVRHTARRSFSVAAQIFFAAIDEFADRGAPGAPNHQELADHLLLAIGRYYNIDVAQFNRLSLIDTPMTFAIGSFDLGYTISAKSPDAAVFYALGVHLASELTAQGEFESIDRVLCVNRLELTNWLQTKAAKQLPSLPVPYYWVSIHSRVETEHAQAAYVAANRALEYYVGDERKQEMRKCIIGGFRKFLFLHAEFMGAIGSL